MSDLIFTEQGAGTTPSAGKHTVYYKTDGKLYTKDTTGAEISLPTLTEIAAAVLTLTNKTLTSPVINGFSGTGNGTVTGNLAVTGTLSATGGITFGTGSLGGVIDLNATNSQVNFKNAGTTKWQLVNDFPSAGQFTVYDTVNAVSRGVFSSTGLAVTGALSATKAVSGATTFSTEQLSIFNTQAGAAGNQATIGFHLNNSDWGPGTTYASVSATQENGTTGSTALTFATAVDGAAAAPTERMRLNATGLAVTGTLSATGGGVISTLANVGANSLVNLTTANSAVKLGVGYVGTDNPAIQAYDTTNNSRTLDLNPLGGLVRASGGLAVTGALSATGKLNLNGTAATVSEASLVSGTTTNAAYHRLTNTGADSVLGIAGSGGAEILAGGLAYATQLYTVGATALQLGTNSSVKATLDASGNLGLGVTPSAWGSQWKVLQIKSGALYASDAYTIVSANMVGQSGSDSYFVSGAQATRYLQVSGQHQWQTAPSGTAGNAITFTQAMTLDANGNLGLGVTPSAWGSSYRVLQVNGYLAAFGATNAGPVQSFMSSNCYNNSGWKYGLSGSLASYYEQFSGTHAWYTAPSGTAGNPITFTQAMTLDASGNLLVGTTSALAKVTIANGTAVQFAGAWRNDNPGTQYFHSFNYNGTEVGSIKGSNTTTSYLTSSDARLKENITNASDASSLIDALQVRQFDWKSDGSHQRYGFVAQELYEVAPEAVSKPQDPDEMMAVDYSKLVPMLIKEVQSLRARVAQLEGI